MRVPLNHPFIGDRSFREATPQKNNIYICICIYIYVYIYNCLRLCQPRIPQLPARSNPAALYCRKTFRRGNGSWCFFFSGIFVSYGPWDSQDPKEYWWGEKLMGYGTQTELIHHNKGFMGGCSSIFAYLFWGAGNEIMSEHSLYLEHVGWMIPNHIISCGSHLPVKLLPTFLLSNNKTHYLMLNSQLLLVTGYSRSC